MKNILIISSVAVLFSACMKEELPVPAVPTVPSGDAIAMNECMGPAYRDQLWIDLGSGTVVNTNDKLAWDLAFESAPDGWRIWLNGAKLMTAWDQGTVDIAQAHDTVGMSLGRRIDAPSGHLDSTAFGDWRGRDAVFVVDMGFNSLGQSLGFRKFRFTSVTTTAYTFDVANLDGSQMQTVTVPKDPSRHHTCFKLGSGVQAIEPLRGVWDLVLTQYTHQFYEPIMPYLVVGMLSAPRVRVAQVNNADFAAVTLADTLQHPFHSSRDAIGYDWKTYSFDEASFNVDDRMVYIVQDAQGFFFKMHFLDFYGEQGQTGCPLFHITPL
jgi:hypothetical protein